MLLSSSPRRKFFQWRASSCRFVFRSTAYRVILFSGLEAPHWASDGAILHQTEHVTTMLIPDFPLAELGLGTVLWLSYSWVHRDPEKIQQACRQAELAAMGRFVSSDRLLGPLDEPFREEDLGEVDACIERVTFSLRNHPPEEMMRLTRSELTRLLSSVRGRRKFQAYLWISLARWTGHYSEIIEADPQLHCEVTLLSDDGAFVGLDDYLSCLYKFWDLLRKKLGDIVPLNFADRVVEFVKNRLDSTLTMTMVANHFSMNYSQFSREFKDQSGLGFHEFLLQKRIEKSIELLLKSTLKVFEIARETGYRDTKHFLKVFRERVGFSPTEFRQSMAKE